MIDYLADILRAIRIADVLDIAFISVLLYAVLTWFRETTSRSVYVGISILAAVYFVARAFDMYLTTLFFQAVFTVLLVALVVVFQEDIRRVFERIARLGAMRGRRGQTTTFSYVDVLVEVATDLASKKVGGLMVVGGREPLDRHIDGGIEADARITKPLLDSIFDPHSMGHDGAVIIQNGRVRMFAAHLPLSKNIKQVGTRGTRHSAALGLSEVSDSLVVVISEERGEISVAQGGTLKVVASPAELQDRLERFHATKAPPQTEQLRKRLLTEHAGLKAISVLLACVAWYLLGYQAGTVQQTFVVPIEFRNVPQDIVFDDPPTQVRVTLSGRERALALLAPSTLKVSLNLEKIDEGSHRVPVEDEDVKRPVNLAVYQLEPRVLRLEAQVIVPTELTIEVRTRGLLPDEVELKQLQVAPRSIRAMIWRAEKETTRTVFTEPIDLTEITKTSTLHAQLDLPRSVRFVEGKPPTVRVTVVVAENEQSAFSDQP